MIHQLESPLEVHTEKSEKNVELDNHVRALGKHEHLMRGDQKDQGDPPERRHLRADRGAKPRRQ